MQQHNGLPCVPEGSAIFPATRTLTLSGHFPASIFLFSPVFFRTSKRAPFSYRSHWSTESDPTRRQSALTYPIQPTPKTETRSQAKRGVLASQFWEQQGQQLRSLGTVLRLVFRPKTGGPDPKTLRLPSPCAFRASPRSRAAEAEDAWLPEALGSPLARVARRLEPKLGRKVMGLLNRIGWLDFFWVPQKGWVVFFFVFFPYQPRKKAATQIAQANPMRQLILPRILVLCMDVWMDNPSTVPAAPKNIMILRET